LPRRCLIVPGNGCGGGDFRDVNFYGWLADELNDNSTDWQWACCQAHTACLIR
jgi:hypothetical protein